MMDNKNNFINAEIFLDNIIRKYKVKTTSKYTISGRSLFEVSSKKEMSIVCSEIVDNHYLLDIKILNQTNTYGLEFLEQKSLELLDKVNDIQSHLLISMDLCGKLKDVLNFTELHEKWERIKTDIRNSSVEISKIISDGNQLYAHGSQSFAAELNKTIFYKALGMSLIPFDGIKKEGNKTFLYNTSSLLFPQIEKKVSIVLDDIVHFSDTPATLLTLKNKVHPTFRVIRQSCSA
ncbi:hypothetical protein J5A54_08020 [Prevotella melaninogenica]|uniref:hypothetical protein n=1 Tax=Prevotella melaninogenica TaxID=28132 RepID=UPI001BAD9AE4|nr:hypothetical protein [Prevotella melaninogenica]QUB64400.1 hypothetical protein J5A54_08020 [Prevotella melaninogenica]